MADLADVLDQTEPLECEFLGHKIRAHIYTSGSDRLTKEEREQLRKLFDGAKGEGEESQSLDQDAAIDYLRGILPIMLSGIDLDDSPIVYRGKEFPENLSLFPDKLLIAIGNPVVDAWNKSNPTNGAQAPNGSQLEGTQANLQTENILPENKSDLPPSG